MAQKPSDRKHFDLLRNPLSSEFGVTTLTQMEQLIGHELSTFKVVRCCDCVIQQNCGQYHSCADRVNVVRYRTSKKVLLLLHEPEGKVIVTTV